MKIEMMLPTLSAAGMEVMVARMATKLARRGHEVGIACIEAGGPLTTGLASAGVRCDVLEARGLIGTEWVKRLVRHLKKVRPDVLHLHSGGWLKGAVAGRIARVPRIIYTAHGFVDPEPWQEKVANRTAIPLTDHIVAVSEHLAEHLAKGGVPRRRLSVIANGIDCELFRPRNGGAAGGGEIRRRLSIAESTVLLGIVARMAPIKNHAMLIEAVALARASGIDCSLVLIGDGPLKGDLEGLAKARGIADRVHFWGLEANVARLYPELDVFVLSSNLEGTSISLLEAMASGDCVLATDVGGNPAVVGDAGVLVAPRRPDLMAEAIAALAASPERRQALGTAARKRVETKFSDEAMIAAYERLYGVQ